MFTNTVDIKYIEYMESKPIRTLEIRYPGVLSPWLVSVCARGGGSVPGPGRVEQWSMVPGPATSGDQPPMVPWLPAPDTAGQEVIMGQLCLLTLSFLVLVTQHGYLSI